MEPSGLHGLEGWHFALRRFYSIVILHSIFVAFLCILGLHYLVTRLPHGPVRSCKGNVDRNGDLGINRRRRIVVGGILGFLFFRRLAFISR